MQFLRDKLRERDDIARVKEASVSRRRRCNIYAERMVMRNLERERGRDTDAIKRDIESDSKLRNKKYSTQGLFWTYPETDKREQLF